ncbi:tyrosine--tRNA ligase [Dermatobacter hominis]|uniref:tyrosine--tRNA ligase n=1 Tax=Dermatobacter hominis TaxID=2884263 RepID=UPI001D11442E|nr:tyrosine--tRNA ligase [Dermatobacter hominis]UDY36236.1 tyrosine--tRNA ligase [Dermatobacter hominis]
MTGDPAVRGSGVIDDLVARGLVHDHTDLDALRARLDDGPTPTYCGFDPTADSLHIGNLQSIMLLRRFQDAGHPPIALVGGATGMIGDPSGRSDERQFLDAEVLDANRAAIANQLGRFLDFDGPAGAVVVDNRSWTEPVGVLEFLRDVGKHITIGTMMAKDSVKSRLERESGISFTEFSYMLLQANDFHVLHAERDCDLQVAGSDQWGNITAGIDLVRRRTGDVVHGLTAPLIVRADGTKFGKSEGENIWLDPARTSPYRLYQYFLNVADSDVEPLLLRLTTVPVAECRAIAEAHADAPERREGQRALARALTATVHGPDALEPIEEAAAVLFGDRPITDVAPATLELLASEVPSSTARRSDVLGADPLDLLAADGVALAKSKGEARRNPDGYSVNQVRLPARDGAPVGEQDLLHGRFLLLGRGKRNHHLITVGA